MQRDRTDGRGSYRYERKFIVPLHMVQDLASILRHSSFGFTEIFEERFVNNVYFDTPLFRFYNENVQGLADRKKIRIRWYGERTPAKEYRLEIKRKSGAVGCKEVYSAIVSNNEFTAFSLLNTIAVPDHVRIELMDLRPMLFNRYRRRYFLSADRKYRATMDYDLRYSLPTTVGESETPGGQDGEAVLELKYENEADLGFSGIADELPFNFSKKSKYISGIDNVYVF